MKKTTTKSNERNGEIEILRNAMLFSLSVHKWGNRAVLSSTEKKDKVQTTDVDKDALHITKRLLESKELDDLHKMLDAAQAWCISRSMISNIRKGVYLVKRTITKPSDNILAFDAELEKVNGQVKEKLDAFFKTYAACKAEAKKKLGPVYNEDNYPTEAEMRATYYVEWNWFGLSVPDELPDEVRKRENAKLRATYAQAQEEVRYALREGFKKLVAHAVERLEVKPGKEAKVLRDKSLVANFKEFFETFNARDLTNDNELAKAMEAARKTVDKFDPDAVRESVDIRNEVAAQFEAVNKQLDGLLKDKPARRFQFD